MRFRTIWPLPAILLVAFAPSCSRRRSLGPGEELGGNAFVAPDAGSIDAAEAGLLSYCPSSECPRGGWTTCPDSRFPCDANIWTDPNNCGGCGIECPEAHGGRMTCVEGVCTLGCLAGVLDCDGLLDNGCEASKRDNDSCGSCGTKCLDPEKPCVPQDPDETVFACGCPAGQILCGTRCRDVRNDDNNCGGCNVRCDPTGGGAPAYPNAYYGCSNSECGAVKCSQGFDDCDGSIDPNGCETSTGTDDDCGSCGRTCPPDQACRLDLANRSVPDCMCLAGLTYCPGGTGRWGTATLDRGRCLDLTADQNNCGACGAACPSVTAGGASVCRYGRCAMRCYDGSADCNHSESDGCEVDTNSDPRNCGGCGIVCDAVAGQACVGGRCVVEPCDEGGGGVTQ